MLRVLGVALSLLLSSSTFAGGLTESPADAFKDFAIIDFKDESGIIFQPSLILGPDSKSAMKGLPPGISEKFDDTTGLLFYQTVLKVSKDYEAFTKAALKNKASIEKNLLHNSSITVEGTDGENCPLPITGVFSANLEIPKFFSAFNLPEKLQCNISISSTGTGKRQLRTEVLAKLPPALNDEDVRFVNLNFSDCNTIFAGIGQRIFFIKASDGKTLLLIDNYSLVKKTTIKKLEAVKLFIGSPAKFINSQIKKDMAGLLAHINGSQLK